MSSFISAGHHRNSANPDPGAQGVLKVNEGDLTIELRDLVVPAAKKLGMTIIVDQDNETLSQYLTRIKPGSGSVVVEFHFNASDNASATGAEVIVGDGATLDSRKFAKELADVTATTLGIKNRGVITESQSARGRLGLMREAGIVALVEVCFITNVKDYNAYQANKYTLAQKYAQIIKKYDDLSS